MYVLLQWGATIGFVALLISTAWSLRPARQVIGAGPRIRRGARLGVALLTVALLGLGFTAVYGSWMSIAGWAVNCLAGTSAVLLSRFCERDYRLRSMAQTRQLLLAQPLAPPDAGAGGRG